MVGTQNVFFFLTSVHIVFMKCTSEVFGQEQVADVCVILSHTGNYKVVLQVLFVADNSWRKVSQDLDFLH